MAHKIVAASLMPICEERTLMDYLSMSGLFFGCLSLLETVLVMFLWHQEVDTWCEAFSPKLCSDWARARKKGVDGPKANLRTTDSSLSMKMRGSSSIAHEKKLPGLEGDGLLLRKNFARQLFLMLDEGHNDELDLNQVSMLGRYMMEEEWSTEIAREHFRKFGQNGDGVMDFSEFFKFCERTVATLFTLHTSTQEYQNFLAGFVEVLKHEKAHRVEMWRNRAKVVDLMAVWGVAPAYLVHVAFLFGTAQSNSDEEVDSLLHEMAFEEDEASHIPTSKVFDVWLYLTMVAGGLCVCLCLCVVAAMPYCCFKCSFHNRVKGMARTLSGNEEAQESSFDEGTVSSPRLTTQWLRAKDNQARLDATSTNITTDDVAHEPKTCSQGLAKVDDLDQAAQSQTISNIKDNGRTLASSRGFQQGVTSKLWIKEQPLPPLPKLRYNVMQPDDDHSVDTLRLSLRGDSSTMSCAVTACGVSLSGGSYECQRVLPPRVKAGGGSAPEQETDRWLNTSAPRSVTLDSSAVEEALPPPRFVCNTEKL